MAQEEVTRRLATILATDMVGYSRLVEADEEGTLARQRRHRAELIDPSIEAHRGRIVKSTGDGLLVEFASAVDAVRCAVEVQAAMAEREAGAGQDRRIAYRVGINVGDIVVEDEDIYGDGVNVAARLEALAEPGGICLSRTVRDQVRDRLEVALEDLGEVAVKNIARPVRVFRVRTDASAAPDAPPGRKPRLWAALAAGVVIVAMLGGGLAWWRPWTEWAAPTEPETAAGRHLDKPSIAVLPFTNMSGDAEQEYFSDGITEDIITDLSKLSGLFVVARNSSFTYKGKAVKIQEVGRDLGVRHVLEGSVRKSGGRVRITAQLIDAASGDHVWAERYDRDLTDVFAVQDEVTREIVAVLAVKLSGREAARLGHARRVDPDAYDMLLRGLERLRRYSRATNAEARGYFEKAIAIDPSYARAYADIGYTHALDLFNGYSDDREESLRQSEAAIEAALRLDAELPQVHFARASLLRFQRRYDEALATTRTAIELDPNYAEGYASMGLTLIYLGRAQEGLEAVRTAMRLNPHNSFFYYWVLGLSYFHLERYEEAAVAFEQVVERNPQFLRGRLLLAATWGQMGRIEEAEWEVEEALTLLPGITLSQRLEIVPYKRQIEIDRYIDGLRKAGLAE